MFFSKQQRFLEYLVAVWVILTLNFALPRMMPGDPFVILSAAEGQDHATISEAQQRYYRELYVLDRPLVVQYGSYFAALARLDLGYSMYYNEPVSAILLRRLPWTLFLVTAAVALSTILGTLAGGISAHRRQSAIDRWLYLTMIALSEIPAFLLGLLLLFFFVASLRLFPLSGALTPFKTHENLWLLLADMLRHAALPVATLTIARLGGIYLLARGSMATVLTKDYLRTARAKGLTAGRIFSRHLLRNALLPIVTRVFMSLGSLVAGAILVENVFAYPGLGRLMRESVLVCDYPLIQGIFLLVTISVLTANYLADRLYRRLDPRIDPSPCAEDSRKGMPCSESL
jgi:peptide/nickel transport system permease protein